MDGYRRRENTDFTAIARRADGKLVLGSADVAKRNTIFACVDSIVVQGNTAVVLDRAQTSVTTIGADSSADHDRHRPTNTPTATTPARRAPYGLAGSRALGWVSQTASNIVIGYDLTTGTPVEKVRYPIVQQPNSLAFDDASDTLYVVPGSGAGVQAIEHAAGPS